jgi:transposase, IS30 family
MSFSRDEWAVLRARFLERLAVVGFVPVVAAELGVRPKTGWMWARQARVRSRRPPHPGKAEFHRLRREGASRAEAASAVGVHPTTARDWDRGVRKLKHARVFPDGSRVDYRTGRTTMVDVNDIGLPALERRLHPRFLTLQDRERIADLRRAGTSLRQIGRELGRPASTIKRELDTHQDAAGRYAPYRAQRQAAGKRIRPRPRKLLQPGPLRSFVEAGLVEQWSPEQISNMLRVEFPDDEGMRVSTETIYQALYVQARGGLKREVQAALRTGRTRRKPHVSPTQRASRFTDPMVMISDRPAEIEDRAVPGHWEGDLIVGPASRSAILTLVERHTRYVMLGHLPDGHSAEQVRDVLVPLIGSLPAHLRGSLTWDQGSEMAAHRQFQIATGIPVFFCDPASPWQRGSNENTNGLLRQYFPKGTDLSVHGPLDLEHVAQKLNRRPRKTLDWNTPAQRLASLLQTT